MNQLSQSALSANSTKGDTHFFSRTLPNVLLQEISTQRYLGNGGGWTTELAQARNFHTRSTAIEHALAQKLQNVQLVVTLEVKECHIMPLKPPVEAVQPD
jgi:hypothetical protein